MAQPKEILGHHYDTQVDDIRGFKAHLFRREVTPQNQLLIDKATNNFFRSATAFSERLLKAITGDGLYEVDTFGRRKARSQGEVVSLLRDAKKPFGDDLAEVVKGKEYIDLGCGNPEYSHVPRLVAGVYGASSYIGVDIASVDDELRREVLPDGTPLQVAYIKDDMLDFVSRLGKGVPRLFYISGIEPVHQNRDTEAYIRAVLTEIQQVTDTGDAVVIGQGTHGFDPTSFDFRPKQIVEGTDAGENRFLVQGLYVRD